MILPKTLSRDVLVAIGKGPLLDNLKNNPEILSKFFFQAIQSPAWCHQSPKVLCKTASILYGMLCTGVLPWDTVNKTMTVVCRFFSITILRPMTESKEDEGVIEAYNFVKFIMSRNCSMFREKNMYSRSLLEVKPIFEIISMSEYSAIASTFITDRFDKFYPLPLMHLRSYLMQCKSWGYAKGIETFQRIYAERINDCRTAMMAIAFADMQDFNIIKRKAIEVIESLEFCVVSSSEHTYYSQLTFGSSFDTENMKLSLEERKKNDELIFTYNRCPKMAIQSLGFQESGFVVGYKVVEEESELIKTRRIYQSSKKCRIPRDKTKHLSFDRKCCVNLEFLLGALIYFNEVDELEIHNFEVNWELFNHISRIRRGLKDLKFHNCYGLTEDLLNSISYLFPYLTNLYFLSIQLLPKTFLSFKKIKNLNQLIIDKCSITLPQDLSFFSGLKSIAISNESRISAQELQRLWSACSNVQDICVVKLEQFDPRLYPYPEKILNISVHTNDLTKWLDGDELAVICLFPNLTSLIVYGNTYSGTLLRALSKLINTTKVTVDLKEYNDSNF